MVEKYKTGYTTGVFDLFHIGHLNILKKAKEHCEYLIVEVTVDDLVSYKQKKAFIPFDERMAIVGSIKYVDKVVPQVDLNKFYAWEKYKYNVIFVGSDWKGSERWDNYERKLKIVGVDVVYLPYTKGTSSTILRDVLLKTI